MRDPIVEEVHRIREKLLEECGGDLNKLLDRYEAAESLDQDRLVDLEFVQRRKQQSESRERGH